MKSKRISNVPALTLKPLFRWFEARNEVFPPDQPARRAVWQRYLGAAKAGIEVDRLAVASELFTPADIEFAARKGSQAAFEREMRDGGGRPAVTEDYLTAIGQIRPTLTAGMLAEFDRGKDDFAGL